MATPRIETVKFGPALAKLVVVYERLLEGLFPVDGSGAEPATYVHFSMEGMSWGMAALHALQVRPRGYDRMMRVFRWARYAKVQPSLVLDTGDSGTEMNVLSGFAWGAEYAGDPALRAYYDAATEKSLRESSPPHVRRIRRAGHPRPVRTLPAARIPWKQLPNRKFRGSSPSAAVPSCAAAGGLMIQ